MRKACILISVILLGACADTGSSNSKSASASNDLNAIILKAQADEINKSAEVEVAKKNQSHSMADNPALLLIISFAVGALSASAVTAVIFRKKLSKL